jgi:hypothetical protein
MPTEKLPGNPEKHRIRPISSFNWASTLLGGVLFFFHGDKITAPFSPWRRAIPFPLRAL